MGGLAVLAACARFVLPAAGQGVERSVTATLLIIDPPSRVDRFVRAAHALHTEELRYTGTGRMPVGEAGR